MPQPIFLVGIQRSGTTWLANLLGEHSQIASVTHPKHFGAHESCYFECIYGRYGDLASQANYVEFVEVMSASDFFVLAGADKEFLYNLYPATYEQVFRKVMDALAEREGKQLWIEKSPEHTLHMTEIAEYYPDARFVAIQRDARQQIGSELKMLAVREDEQKRERRLRLVIRSILRWAYYKRVIDEYEKSSNRIYVIQYSHLSQDTETELRRLSDFLGIEFEESMLLGRFERNTSFAEKSQREKALSRSEELLITYLSRLISLLPTSIIRAIHNKLHTSKSQRPLPKWFFRISRNSDREEMLQTNNEDASDRKFGRSAE